MAIPKIWWLDDADLASSKRKLNSVKAKQLPDWDVLNFDEDAYSEADAYRTFIDEIGSPSIFAAGKIVVLHKVPSFQAKFSKDVSRISENVMVVIIAKIDKTLSLHKAVSSMAQNKLAVLDDRLKLTQSNSVEWISGVAKELELQIDDRCCKMLADACSFDPSVIRMELTKIKHMSEDGSASPSLIEMSCSEPGEADIFKMCDAILNGDEERAHAMLQRLLDHGEEALKMCGFLMDWSRRLAVAASCGDRYSEYKNKLIAIKKLQKKDGDVKEASPMFVNPGSIYQSYKSIESSKRTLTWTYDMIKRIGALQIDLRKGMSEDQTMHYFVAAATRGR